MTRKLTGVDSATVRVLQDDHVISQCVRRWEELPENLVEGQEERLEALGAFNLNTEREQKLAAKEQQREALKRIEEQML